MQTWGTTIVATTLVVAGLSGCSITVQGGLGKGSSNASMAWAQVLERSPNPASTVLA